MFFVICYLPVEATGTLSRCPIAFLSQSVDRSLFTRLIPVGALVQGGLALL